MNDTRPPLSFAAVPLKQGRPGNEIEVISRRAIYYMNRRQDMSSDDTYMYCVNMPESCGELT